jgi:hypothetical protein
MGYEYHATCCGVLEGPCTAEPQHHKYDLASDAQVHAPLVSLGCHEFDGGSLIVCPALSAA